MNTSDHSDFGGADAVAYHLHLEGEEVGVAVSALRLLIDGAAHEVTIRRLGREVLAQLPSDAAPAGRPLAVSLSPGGLKILHTALRLLLDDLQRGQADERQLLWRVLHKLPDEHSIRAIALP